MTVDCDKTLAITGLGVLSPYGTGKDAFWRGLLSGEPRIEEIAPGEPTLGDGEPTLGARIPDFDPSQFDGSRAFRLLPKSTQMAMICSQLAWEDAGLPAVHPAPERVGIYLGTTYGILDDLARFEGDLARHGLAAAKPSVYQELTLGALAGHVSIQHGTRGPVIPLSHGWLSGHASLRLAALALESGEIDIALVGAIEQLGPWMIKEGREGGWLRTRGAGGPPCAAEGGLAPGEGASILVLEPLAAAERRGARSYCVLRGFGAGAADRPSAFDDHGGAALAHAMLEALSGREERLHVDFVSGLGCGHPAVDRAEALALKRVLGDRRRDVAVCALPATIGHAGSAAGVLGVAAAALAIHHGVTPGAAHRPGAAEGAEADPLIDRGRRAPVRAALANAFSWEGAYGATLLEAAPGT